MSSGWFGHFRDVPFIAQLELLLLVCVCFAMCVYMSTFLLKQYLLLNLWTKLDENGRNIPGMKLLQCCSKNCFPWNPCCPGNQKEKLKKSTLKLQGLGLRYLAWNIVWWTFTCGQVDFLSSPLMESSTYLSQLAVWCMWISPSVWKSGLGLSGA